MRDYTKSDSTYLWSYYTTIDPICNQFATARFGDSSRIICYGYREGVVGSGTDQSLVLRPSRRHLVS